jgi:hypothetical protein
MSNDMQNESVQNGTTMDHDSDVSRSDIEEGLGRIRLVETKDGLELKHHITARERFFSEYSKFAVKTAQSTVEMCRVVYEAKKSLQKSEYDNFLLDIGRKTEDSTIRKYLAIGERYDDLIAHTNLLPASWTSIYAITQLPADSFMAMVTLGESMANLTGAQLKRLKSINAGNNSAKSTVPKMPSTNVKRSASVAANESEQSVDSEGADSTVESTDALISAHTTASASSDASKTDDEDADSSSDNEFAQQATSSLLGRVSQNTIATADVSLNAEEEADEPYEVVIRFKSRPSTDATHAIVEALTSVFSKHRVEAEILTKETEAI